MGRKRIGHGLYALPTPTILRATDWRADVHTIEKSRGSIAKGRRAIERIRQDTVPPDRGMLRLERLEQAQGELCLRGRRGMGRWFGRPL
jgi:hypothetical protein